MKKKIGLCLTGGGAKGAYQIGAVQALYDLGVYNDISAVAGTSIGAANSVILATTSIETAKSIWFNIPENPIDTSVNFLDKLKKEKLKAFDSGLYTMEAFDKIMIETVNFEVLKEKEVYITISEGGKESKGILDLFKTSFNHYVRKQGKVHYMSLKELDQETSIKVVKASCSIPIAFPPVVLDNKKYYDGGVYDNIPILPLVENGCTEIYVIDIATFRPIFNIFKKYSHVTFHHIKPKFDIGQALDFTNKHSKEIYDLGYKDTIEYYNNM